MFKRIAATRREWGLFGLRWVFPVALVVFGFVVSGSENQQYLVPIVLLAAAFILSNLAIALLQVLEYWAVYVTILVIILDTGLAGYAIYLTDIRLAWIGLIPLGVLGLYFDWLPGVIAGTVAAAALVIMQLFFVENSLLNVATLILLLTAFPAVGPLAALIGYSDSQPVSTPRKPRPARRSKTEEKQASSARDTEYVDIMYEMVEVLSASKLDPNRVLDTAVNFGLEGLARVGVAPPLFGAALLYAADSPDGLGDDPVLAVVRASDTLRPGDTEVVIPGKAGAVAETLARNSIVVVDNPARDEEISRFESFRTCKTVLSLPLATGKDTYGILLIGGWKVERFDEKQVDLMRAVANQAAASLHNAMLYGALREQRDRIVEVEKSARAQLAADLHDGPTQAVSAITMRLNFIRRIIEKDPPEAMNELYQIEDLARRTAKEIRAMLFQLRPKSLERGLAAGLEQLARQMKETYNQDVVVQVVDGCDSILDSHTSATLFSIVTELVNNARKHAEADVINVRMEPIGEMLRLQISDQGKGFDVEKALAEAREREGHLGLINLFERAALVEGILDINSAPGKGTQTTINIPLEVLRLRKTEESERARQGAL
nr:GAF domain-containing sensor histidine kinase [Anaerolineae bacterium]